MKFPLLENSFTSRSKDINPSLTVNLFAEISPPESKSQIALISRPGLTLMATMAGISRGVYVFNGIQYHVIGNQVYSFTDTNTVIDGGNASTDSDGLLDGGSASTTASATVDGGSAVTPSGTLTNLTTTYGWPNLATSSGPVTFTDNGISPAGGNQILICDGTYLYVININPTIFVNIMGDGNAPDGSPSAVLIPTVVNGVITALTIPAGLSYSGSGYTHAAIKIIGGNPSVTATATATLQGGSVSIIQITVPGSNYLTTPTVYISPPDIGGGVQATATVSQSQIYNGQIQSVTLTNIGSGYSTSPSVTFSGNGSAQATAVINGGGITGSTVTTGGSGYGTPSFIQISASGTTASGTVYLGTASIYQINVSSQGAGYTSAPALNISGGGGVGAAAAVTLSGGSGARGVVSNLSSGTFNAKNISIVYPGSGYTQAPIVSFYGGGGSGAAGTSIISGVVSSVNIVNGGLYDFRYPPLVTFQGGGGSGARAHVTLNGAATTGGGEPMAAINSIAIDSGGSGYTTAPTVAFTNITPVGLDTYRLVETATGTVTISSGVVGITMTNIGTGYTSVPNIMFLNPIEQIGVLAPGYNYSSTPTITMPSVMNGITFSHSGTYTAAPAVVIAAPTGSNPVTAAASYFFSGQLTFAVITNQGSGYTSPPIATLSGGNGNGGATTNIGPVIISADGQVTDIPITDNDSYGYTTGTVSLVFTGGGGSGAAGYVLYATADTIVITDPGSGYLTAPAVTISGGTGGSASATASISGATAAPVLNYPVSYIAVTNTGSHYTDAPTVTINDPQGTGAVAIANVNEGMVTSIWVTEVGANYTPGSTTVTIEAPTGFPAAVSPGATAPGISSVNQISGWGIISQAGNAIFQTSELSDFTIWPGLNFAAKYNVSDPFVCVGNGNINGYLALFGQATTELWAISPQNMPPFVYSSTINVGLAALQSLVAMDNTYYMLANSNNNGRGEFLGIARFNGNTFDVISTDDINAEIQDMTTISDATAYSYTRAKHVFYVITFPTGNKTYAYDASTGKWARRSSSTGNIYTQQREIPQYYCAYGGLQYVTDYNSGNLYVFDDSNYTDNGSPLVRLRISPPIFDKEDYHFIQHDRLEIDMGTNVANPDCADPQAVISFSDDGGWTWSQDYSVSIGNSSWGNKLRCVLDQLGDSQKRAYRIVVSDPVRVALIAGYLTGTRLKI